MSSYEPSPYTALAIYAFAAAHQANIPVNTEDYPGMTNIEESTPGNFIIMVSQSYTSPGRFALCSYNPTTALWHNRLTDGEALILRDDAGQFTVVGLHKFQDISC